MRKRGFTLIELLLIVALASVVFALLAPAINRARQDNRAQACRNNLKMIGLAMHNYHDAFIVFPPGWVAREGQPGNGTGYGWGTMILPFIDQAPLYNKINFRSMPQKPDKTLQTSVPAYLCPADSTPAVNTLRGGFGTSNYAGNYGDKSFPVWLPAGQSDAWLGGMEAPMKSTGLFARNSCVRIREITDGTSNTMMAGERSSASGGAIWPGVTDNGHPDDVLSDTSHRSRPQTGPSSFSSPHGGSVGILLSDGAVRSIDAKIDSKPAPDKGVWQRLGNKSDGQPIGEF